MVHYQWYLFTLVVFFLDVQSCSLPRVPLPPMGLNTWYAWGEKASFARTTQGNLLAVADYMASSGLRDLGYKFLVVDDGWSSGSRSAGGLDANISKFPSGMHASSEYVRDLGLSLGLYTTPGKYTCAGQSGGGERGSKGHAADDVRKWVGDWGVGWVKDCVCNSTQVDRRQAYHDFRMAIDALSSTTVLECNNYMDAPWRRDAITGRVPALDCDVYTVSDDVPDDFDGWNLIVDLAEAQGARFPEGAGINPCIWPSFDYVRVGGAQSEAQYQAQIGFMAIAPAPLFIGSELNINDKNAMLPTSVLHLYSAKGVIAIHQDRLGARGKRIRHDPTGHNGAFMDVYVRPLSGSRVAVLLLNRSARKEAFTLDIADLTSGLGQLLGAQTASTVITDAWTGQKTVLRERAFVWHVEATSAALLVLAEQELVALHM